jgi:DNA-binding response OmpR family regulator
VKTILIVDRDLGFVYWLGRVLDDAGYEAIPARRVPDAIQLLHELHTVVDLLIVNMALPGAADLVRALRRSARPIRVMSLLESPDETPASPPGSDAVRSKPEEVDEISKLEWVDAIDRLLGCPPRMPSICLG